MTKLTNDTAFNDISQTYISPSKLTMITATVKVTINAILKLNPRRRKVTTNMAAERKKTEKVIRVMIIFFDLNTYPQNSFI